MHRAVLSFIVLAVLAVVPTGNGGRAADTPAHSSIAGQFLVAAPSMRDPRFAGTVILMIKHSERGALGFVINRVNGRRPIAEILTALGRKSDGITGNIDMHWGGPVERNIAVVLHSRDYKGKDTRNAPAGLALTGDPDILQAIGRGKGPKRAIFLRGYAGWGPGQLERELAAKAWVVVPADRKVVFARNHHDTWKRAYARRGTDL